jgi:fatty acid desaturase
MRAQIRRTVAVGTARIASTSGGAALEALAPAGWRDRTAGLAVRANSPADALAEGNRAYGELKRALDERGLFERDRGFYARQLAVALALVGGSLVLTAAGGWFLGAVVMTLAYAQLTFLRHDAGHNQVFARTSANTALALLVINVLVGGSRSWWVEKHNRHHGAPNTLAADPDIDIPVIAFDVSQAHAKRGVSRFIVRYQSVFFFPLLVLEAAHLRIQSVRWLLGRLRRRTVIAELGLIGFNLALYGGAIVAFAGANALPFMLVHHGLLGVYLGSTFATNHQGMPILGPGVRLDFLRQQVLTARNLTRHPLMDFLFGPLSCQIEHHLFPAMARSRLRSAAPYVRAFCDARAIPYHETGVRVAFAEVLGHLHAVGRTLRSDEGGN